MEIQDCRVLILQKFEVVGDYLKDVAITCGVKENNIYFTDDVGMAKELIGANKKINLVITRIGFYETIGPNLLKWMKNEGIREKIAVYFYSGGDEAWVKEKFEEYKADGFLPLTNVNSLKEKIINSIKAI